MRTSEYILVYYTKYTVRTRKSMFSLNPTHCCKSGGNNLFNAQINGYKRFLKVRRHQGFRLNNLATLPTKYV